MKCVGPTQVTSHLHSGERFLTSPQFMISHSLSLIVWTSVSTCEAFFRSCLDTSSRFAGVESFILFILEKLQTSSPRRWLLDTL